MDRTVVASLLDSAEERPDSAEHHAGEIPGMKDRIYSKQVRVQRCGKSAPGPKVIWDAR